MSTITNDKELRKAIRYAKAKGTTSVELYATVRSKYNIVLCHTTISDMARALKFAGMYVEVSILNGTTMFVLDGQP